MIAVWKYGKVVQNRRVTVKLIRAEAALKRIFLMPL